MGPGWWIVGSVWLSCVYGQETLTWENMTSLHDNDDHGNWTAKVGADSHAFMDQVIHWMHHVVDASWVDQAHLSTSFHAEAKPKDLEIYACGDVPLHRVGKALMKLLKAERVTKKVTQTTMKLEWKPSKECMKQHGIDNMGGGGGAGFRVLCNDTLLLQASGGGGGALMHSAFGDFFVGGSTIELQLEGGKLKISGGGLGKWGGALVLDTIPEGTDEAIHRVKKEIRQCAANGTLVVRGAGGGGWSEKKTGLDDAAIKEGFSFGFSFEYGVPSNTHVAGEGDQNTTPDEDSPEEDTPEEDTPVEDTPEDETPEEETPEEETPVEDTPVEDTPEEDTPEEDTPVKETPEEETPVEDTPEEDTPVEETPVEETPVEDTPVEDTPVEDTPEEETPVKETPEEETPVEEAPEDKAPVEETPEEEAPVEETPEEKKEVEASSPVVENDTPAVEAVDAPAEGAKPANVEEATPKPEVETSTAVTDQSAQNLEFISAAAAQTFAAVSSSCQDLVNPADMCFMQNSFGKEWYLPAISDKSVIHQETPVVQENILSYGPFAVGVTVIAAASFVLVRTRQRRSGYAQLHGGEDIVSV